MKKTNLNATKVESKSILDVFNAKADRKNLDFTPVYTSNNIIGSKKKPEIKKLRESIRDFLSTKLNKDSEQYKMLDQCNFFTVNANNIQVKEYLSNK